MKCYKTVLQINSLFINYGFFIVGSIVIFYFIDLFIFIAVSFSNVKKEIFYITSAVKIKCNPIKKKKDKIKKKINKKYLPKNNTKNNAAKALQLNKNTKNKSRKNNYQGQITRNISEVSYKKMNPDKLYINNNKYGYKILAQKDFELNSLIYEEALKLDHRNFCQYYISLVKYNHPFLFSFGSYNDYNSKTIKIFLFFFSFCSDLAINALFFTDDTMHKIYEDKGAFNLLYQIPQIIYSTLISKIIDSFIKKFALSQDNISGLKQEGSKINIERKNKKLLCWLKLKFLFFYIIALFLLVFLWYYVTCFCGIYVNTQIHLIKDSIISLITSLVFPFAIYIIPAIFRILSLRVEKPTRKILYNFSGFIENWIC